MLCSRWSARERRACVRCEHCAGSFPDTRLRAHLLHAHAPLLFLCAECDLYQNRGNMMTHMATHIDKSRTGKMPEESMSHDPSVKQAPKVIIPTVRIQRIPYKLTTPPPLVETSSVTSSTFRFHPLAQNSSRQPSLGILQTVALDPPPLRKIDSRSPAENAVLRRGSTETNQTENIELSNDSIPSEHQTAPDRKLPKESEKKPDKTDSPGRANDFSDHSDTENEFGRLPESVFDAIEDSQDARSNDAQDIPDTEQTSDAKKPNLPRPCPICEKQCNSLSGWYYHLKRAHGSHKNVACDKCNKLFATKSELVTHARTHTAEKPFACRTCSSVFASRAGRYIHEQTHSSRRAHACGRCARAFRWRTQLRRHEARHSATKSHVCSRCGRAFSVAFDLQRHVRAHEPGCHRCDVCNATFKQKRYLKVHMENIHLASSTTSDTKKTCKKSKKVVRTLSAPDVSPLRSLSPSASGDS